MKYLNRETLLYLIYISKTCLQRSFPKDHSFWNHFAYFPCRKQPRTRPSRRQLPWWPSWTWSGSPGPPPSVSPLLLIIPSGRRMLLQQQRPPHILLVRVVQAGPERAGVSNIIPIPTNQETRYIQPLLSLVNWFIMLLCQRSCAIKNQQKLSTNES